MDPRLGGLVTSCVTTMRTARRAKGVFSGGEVLGNPGIRMGSIRCKLAALRRFFSRVFGKGLGSALDSVSGISTLGTFHELVRSTLSCMESFLFGGNSPTGGL